jgi:hypothetical protein
VRTNELLKEALARIVRLHEDYSTLARNELGRVIEQDRTWAEQLAGDLAAAQSLPEGVAPSAEWPALMEGVSSVWLDVLARCTTDEQRSRAHKHFAAAVNALCALACARHFDMDTGGES